MKTASDYGMEIANRFHDNTNTNWEDHKFLASMSAKIIKQIQLDAMKEGAKRAAQVCSNRTKRNELIGSTYLAMESIDCSKSILTVQDQWTINDL